MSLTQLPISLSHQNSGMAGLTNVAGAQALQAGPLHNPLHWGYDHLQALTYATCQGRCSQTEIFLILYD